jgi:hypothetical protein
LGEADTKPNEVSLQFGSPGIMVINVAQASSLHRQDAYATLILTLLITTKSEEPAIQVFTFGDAMRTSCFT